jgi:hypothetical protein
VEDAAWGFLYDPDAELEPDDGAVPYPAGGVPVCEPDPLPMLGQLWVEPEPELVPDDPELVLPDPEFPVLVLVEGVLVEELDVELDPELPVVLEVVAALATKALPAKRPDVSAPMASTLRKRICMGGLPFRVVCCARPFGPAQQDCAADLGAPAERHWRVRGAMWRTGDDSQERIRQAATSSRQ